jgi:hypothetical protein
MLSLEKMSSNKAIKTENEESNIGISRTNKKHVIDVSVEKYVNDVSVKMIVVVAGKYIEKILEKVNAPPRRRF